MKEIARRQCRTTGIASACIRCKYRAILYDCTNDRKDRVSQCESLRHLVSAIACLASCPPMHSENPLAGNRDHSFFRQRYVWHTRVQRPVSGAASCSQVARLLAFYEGDTFVLFSLPEAVGGSRQLRKHIREETYVTRRIYGQRPALPRAHRTQQRCHRPPHP